MLTIRRVAAHFDRQAAYDIRVYRLVRYAMRAAFANVTSVFPGRVYVYVCVYRSHVEEVSRERED